MSMFVLHCKKLGFYMMRRRWIVATCSVIWPALIVVSLIYCKTTLDENGGLGIVGKISQKGSVYHSSSTRTKLKGKLLDGLLSADFNEKTCSSRYQSTLYRKTSPHKPSPHLISTLRSYESIHRRCSPHTESYNKTLQHFQPGDHSTARIDCKYLVHLWMPQGGLGNRLLSLASSFLYALLTNRVLLIDQGHKAVDLLCEPFPDTTWALPLDFPIKNQFDTFNKESPHCYGNMVKNHIIDTSMEKSFFPFMYFNLIYDYDDYDKQFFCDQDQNFMRGVSWLVIRSDQYFIPSLFLIPSFKQELRKLFPEKETVFHHLGRYLFHPSNQVWGLITRYYQAYLAKADERIGIQVRDFKSTNLPFRGLKDHIASYYLPHLAVNESVFNRRNDSYDVTSPLSYMMDRILDCSVKKNLLPKLKPIKNPQESVSVVDYQSNKNSKSKVVLVTSLDSRYFENLRNMYWENPTINGEVIGVFQPSHEGYQQLGNLTHHMKAWAEIYLLSLMDVLITSPWSTFGYVAQGIGGLRPWILNNPQKEMDYDLPCHRAKSMEPCFHFPPFYDCKAKIRTDTGARVPYVQHCEDTSWGLKLVDD
ncbi:unnamed protein product [Camellia sinensis]